LVAVAVLVLEVVAMSHQTDILLEILTLAAVVVVDIKLVGTQ